MTDKAKIRILSISAGLALFVCVGLIVSLGASRSSQSKVKPPEISESTVGPALQLEKAFAAVAAHVKPAVVIVYSEKVVKYEPRSFRFPSATTCFVNFSGSSFQIRADSPGNTKFPSAVWDRE